MSDIHGVTELYHKHGSHCVCRKDTQGRVE